MMRNGGAEVFPLRTSGDGAERSRLRDTRAERWTDEGLERRHKVRLHLQTAGWSHQNYAELLNVLADSQTSSFKAGCCCGGGDTSGRVGSSCRERTRQGRSLTMGVVLQLKDISRDRKNIGNIF